MQMITTQQNDFFISTDKSLLQLPIIHAYLSQKSYWAKGIPIETVQRTLDNSMTFGVYFQGTPPTPQQVGFCRVTSDLATFAYIADVFILEDFRKKGLSKLLMEAVLAHPDLQGLRRWLLATADAHGLYAQFGFTGLDKPENFMQIKLEKPYGI